MAAVAPPPSPLQCFGVRLGYTMYQRSVAAAAALHAPPPAAPLPTAAAAGGSAASLTVSEGGSADPLPLSGIPIDAFLLLAGVASAPHSSLQEAFELFDANRDGFITLEVGCARRGEGGGGRRRQGAGDSRGEGAVGKEHSAAVRREKQGAGENRRGDCLRLECGTNEGAFPLHPVYPILNAQEFHAVVKHASALNPSSTRRSSVPW